MDTCSSFNCCSRLTRTCSASCSNFNCASCSTRRRSASSAAFCSYNVQSFKSNSSNKVPLVVFCEASRPRQPSISPLPCVSSQLHWQPSPLLSLFDHALPSICAPPQLSISKINTVTSVTQILAGYLFLL